MRKLILLFLLIGIRIKSHSIYSQPTSSRGGCVLPKNFVNVRFCSFDCDDCFSGKWIYEPGETVKHLVKVQCEPGHELGAGKVTKVALCLRGQWVPAIPHCYRVCPPLESVRATFKYSFGNIPVDRSTSSILPGTTASYECKPDYVAEQGIDLVCSPSGLWLGTFPKCVLGKEKLENKLNSLNSVCGRSSKTRVKRVGGGENAELGEYPWMAAIGTQESDDPINWHCGGSLISDQYVVTSAFCFLSSTTSLIVRIGDLHLNDTVVDGASPLDLKVDSVVIHDQYNGSTHFNMGLIKMQSKVKFNDLMQPICLPPLEFSENSLEGYTVELAGWDTQGYFTGTLTLLQKIVLNITSLDDCRHKYLSYGEAKIGKNHFCAFSPRENSKQCQVDIGSPLMLSQNSRTFLLGIACYRVCTIPNYPSVNFRVPQYTLWILDHMDL